MNFYYSIPLNLRKVILYYTLFNISFLLIQLALNSTFTFFHFLLEHDLITIENWLNRNTWEILTLSKLSSLFFTLKILQLNLYNDLSLFQFIRGLKLTPTKKIWSTVFFILVFFYALIVQFGGELTKNQFKEELVYSSFFGSIVFYISDIFILIFFDKVYDFFKYSYKVLIIPFIFFIISSKVSLPYLNKFHIFLFIHFLTMLYFAKKHNFGDIIVYCFMIIGPLSTLYGLDIVWENINSVYVYQSSLPVVGIIGIWSIAIGYYSKTKIY